MHRMHHLGNWAMCFPRCARTAACSWCLPSPRGLLRSSEKSSNVIFAPETFCWAVAAKCWSKGEGKNMETNKTSLFFAERVSIWLNNNSILCVFERGIIQSINILSAVFDTTEMQSNCNRRGGCIILKISPCHWSAPAVKTALEWSQQLHCFLAKKKFWVKCF